jgi:hypothetical protein
LCSGVAKNINDPLGIYNTGPLHPHKEEGVLFYQDIVRRDVIAHLELEQKVGHEIYPARPPVASAEAGSGTAGGGSLDDDEAVCRRLETGDLDW